MLAASLAESNSHLEAGAVADLPLDRQVTQSPPLLSL